MKKSDRTQRYKGVPAPVARRFPWDRVYSKPDYDAVGGKVVTGELGTPSEQIIDGAMQNWDQMSRVLGETVRSMSAQSDGAGQGLAARLVGSDITPTTGFGYWNGKTSPLAHYRLPLGATPDDVTALASAVGLIAKQDSVGYTMPDWRGGETQTDFVYIPPELGALMRNEQDQ